MSTHLSRRTLLAVVPSAPFWQPVHQPPCPAAGAAKALPPR